MKFRVPFGSMLFLALAGIAITSGCAPNSAGQIPYNEDSVRTHVLSISQGIQYTKEFRLRRDSTYQHLPGLSREFNLGQAEAFNRDAVAVLLNQQDASGARASGIRIYNGVDREGQVRMVLVPYDSHGNDIVNTLVGEKAVRIPGLPTAEAAGGGGQVIEEGQRCPVVCDNGNSGLSGN
jgi:hypothetical protein